MEEIKQTRLRKTPPSPHKLVKILSASFKPPYVLGGGDGWGGAALASVEEKRRYDVDGDVVESC